jgi:potassium/hydrogen antiporter
LLIILFEGGLELDIESVIRQAPKAAPLAVLVFLFSTVSVAAFTFFILHMSLFNSLIIAAIFGDSSPAICLPVVSGLSIKKEIQTILKLESTLGDVLLIVAVVLILDFQIAGSQSSMGMISKLFMSFVVAFVIASIAGAMWSRLIGWLGREPLAYMLTLGFVFLLYFSVEELGGSAAIAVLMFGIMLENMHVVAGRLSDRIRYLFGIDIRAEQDPQLRAEIEMPRSAGEKQTDKLRATLYTLASMLGDSARAAVTTTQSKENRTLTITLRSMAAPGD